MQTFPIIKYLRRLAAARGELLPFSIELDGHVVMCRDPQQAALITSLHRAWRDDCNAAVTVKPETDA